MIGILEINRYRATWRMVIALAVVLGAGQGPAAAQAAGSGEAATAGPADGKGALKTWAVLASDKLVQSGLADQVTVSLSRMNGVVLVDREQIKAVFQERALAELFAAEAASRRRDIGRVLKADALLLLSEETVEGHEFVRLVICDTRAGARLRTDALPWSPGKVGAVADKVAARVRQVREHFAHGVERVYGVPPFVCRNLEHTYDHLQSGYANLLGNALAAQPGVAVIETEEARRIAAELALAGGEVARVTPKFVEGEYEVVRAEGGGEPSVQLTLKVTNGGGKSEMIKESMKLSAAPEFLRGGAAARVSGRAGGEVEKSLTAEEQSAALVARADTFAVLGNPQLSTGLREAALLLEDNGAQRKVLVEEYLKIIGVALPDDRHIKAEWARYDREARDRLAVWHVALGHLEYLIRNRQIRFDNADRLTMQLIFKGREFFYCKLGVQMLPDAERARKKYLRDITPLALTLPGAPKDGLSVWRHYFNNMTLIRSDKLVQDKEDLDFLVDMMENVLPESDYVLVVYDYTAAQLKYPGRFSRQEYVDYLDHVAASKRRVDALASRFSKLRLVFSERYDAKQPTDDLLEDVERLQADLESMPNLAAVNLPLKTRIEGLATEIRKGLAPGMTHANVPNRTGHPPDDTPTRVRFSDIGMKIKTLAGKSVTPNSGQWPLLKDSYWRGLRHMIACGEKRDVFWGSGVVVCEREPGLLEELFVDEQSHFDDIAWDGRNIWIATRHAGLWIVSPEGKVLVKIGEKEGLPPCDARVLLHPLEPGKVCGIGTFNPNRRAWCATIEWKDGQAKVNVFHRATRALLTTESSYKVADADLAFHPAWVHEYRTDAGRYLLVGRICEAFPAMWQPLKIDLATLNVTVFEQRLSGGSNDRRDDPYWLNGNRQAHYSHGGRLLEYDDSNLLLFGAPGEKFKTPFAGNRLFTMYDSPGFNHWLLPWRGWVYAPGSPWVRINAETFAVEKLTPLAFYDHPPMLYFGVSVHHGLVGWTDTHKFYHVAIDELGAKRPQTVPATERSESAPDR